MSLTIEIPADEVNFLRRVGLVSGLGKGLIGMYSLGDSRVDPYSTQDTYVLSQVTYFFDIRCHVMRLTGAVKLEGICGLLCE